MAKKKSSAVRVVGRGSDQFVVRLPDGMRGLIAKMAERNGRSMNAEIVNALAQHISRAAFSQRPPAAIAHLMNEAIAERIRGGDLQQPLREMADKLQDYAAQLDTVVKEARAAAERAVPPEE